MSISIHRKNKSLKGHRRPSIVISSYDDRKNPYYAGGGAHAIYEVARRLSSEYTITIITGAYPGCRNEVVDNISYKRVGLPFLSARLSQVAYQFCLPWQVITREHDIWLESFTPPFSTNCLQLFTPKPVIGIVHMLAGEDMRRKYKLPFELSERVGLKTYNHLIVLSSAMKKKISLINPKARISIIPNGVEMLDVNPELLNKPKEKTHVLFLGRIEVDQKGLDLLLAAYKTVYASLGLPLVIAGGGEKKEIVKLQSLITTLKLEKYVILAGRVQGKKKDELYAKAQSVIVSSRFETYSLVSLEALAYGVPLITFAIPGLTWIPKNACLKVPQFNSNALGQAMLFITENPIRTARMIATGQSYAKKLTWDSIAKMYDVVLKRITTNYE